jgi:hypothetical protein
MPNPQLIPNAQCRMLMNTKGRLAPGPNLFFYRQVALEPTISSIGFKFDLDENIHESRIFIYARCPGVGL